MVGRSNPQSQNCDKQFFNLAYQSKAVSYCTKVDFLQLKRNYGWCIKLYRGSTLKEFKTSIFTPTVVSGVYTGKKAKKNFVQSSSTVALRQMLPLTHFYFSSKDYSATFSCSCKNALASLLHNNQFVRFWP